MVIGLKRCRRGACAGNRDVPPPVCGRGCATPFPWYPAPMKRKPFTERIVAHIVFGERHPERDGGDDLVHFQMPEAVHRLFVAEARRRRTDLNTVVRDVICDALTERTEAIRRINAERDRLSSE